MATQTFTFVSDSSESDSPDFDDKTTLLKLHTKNDGEGHTMKPAKFKKTITLDEEEDVENNNGQIIPPCSPPEKVLKKKSKKQPGKIKSVQDGIKQLEKHELDKKQRTILYQLMVTSAIAMLHGLAITPYFWNNVFLNVHDLQTQTVTMWCVLISYMISFILTPFITQRLSLKWVLAMGCITGSLFICSRFSSKMYIVVPGSIIVGLTMGPFYTAVHCHICNLSTQYEGYQGGKYKDAVFRFTAVLYGWISCSPLWLSVLHIVIFNLIGGEYKNVIPVLAAECGFEYIWEWSSYSAGQNGLSPEFHSVQALLGSCLVCTIGGLLLTIIALTNYDSPTPSHLRHSSIGEKVKEQFCNNLRQLKDSNLLLMLPLFFGMGMMELFCYSIFGQAYIACNFGTDSQFYITLCMSLVAALTSIPSTFIYPRLASTVKVALPAYGFMLTFMFVITFGGYMPYPMFFIMAALIGISNYILTSQIMALVLFHCGSKIDAAFSLLHVGRITAYLMTFVLVRYQGDNSTIMVAIFGTLTMGLFCHTILEIRIKLVQKQKSGASDISGAYVLIDQAPWIPEMDPTTINREKTKALLHRLPTKEELKQCDLTQ